MAFGYGYNSDKKDSKVRKCLKIKGEIKNCGYLLRIYSDS